MSLTDEIYDKLTNSDDARYCDDIPDGACREVPGSFVAILASYSLTKLGDAIASPKTVLAWLTSALGAPGWVLGLLVPLRESGSMVPQLFIGGYVRQLPIRKWVWVAGSVGQAASVAAMAATAFLLEGAAAGYALLAAVACFSLFRSLSSVAAKDVLGKSIPKPKRGQLTGWSAAVAGLLGIGVGVVLMTGPGDEVATSTLGFLLVGAAALWLAGAFVYATIGEQPGEADGGSKRRDSLSRLRLLKSDPAFRRFVTTRALLMCSALSAPFYVALAQENTESSIGALGAFVISSGLAGLVSGPVWGRFADASSRNVMVAAAIVTAAIGLATFGINQFAVGVIGSAWFLPVAYFVLAVAHSGVRVGRKTYVVNLAEGNQRTDYVAVSNTVIGVLLLAVGSVGVLTPVIGHAGVIALLSIMGLTGAVLGLSLPDR